MAALRKILGSLRVSQWFGIGTDGDENNTLAVKGPGSLFDNSGAGHQITVNKASSGDNAGFVFKTNFLTKAILGLLGDNNFSLKVGSSGIVAVVADETTGRVSFPQNAPQVDEFNTPGTFTWTKPAWASRFVVTLVGGGGGGGSGASGDNTAVRAGGGGGGAGAVSIWEFSAADYTGPCTVIVGAGGVPGAAVTNASGINSGNGVQSEFRLNGTGTNFRALIATGGVGGRGGTTIGNGGAGGSVMTYAGSSNAGGSGGTASNAQAGVAP